MTTKTTIPNQIFGEGAPVALAENGTRYFDTSVSPYAEYVFFGGAWSGPIGGGGAAGLPYTAVGSPASWYVNSPYALYLESGTKTVGANKQGGAVVLQGAYATSPNIAYGGNVGIYGGLAVATAAGKAYGGDIHITAGYASGGAYSSGGDIRLIMGYGSVNGELFLLNLPIVNPGGTGSVWNNAGVLNIT